MCPPAISFLRDNQGLCIVIMIGSTFSSSFLSKNEVVGGSVKHIITTDDESLQECKQYGVQRTESTVSDVLHLRFCLKPKGGGLLPICASLQFFYSGGKSKWALSSIDYFLNEKPTPLLGNWATNNNSPSCSFVQQNDTTTTTATFAEQLSPLPLAPSPQLGMDDDHLADLEVLLRGISDAEGDGSSEESGWNSDGLLSAADSSSPTSFLPDLGTPNFQWPLLAVSEGPEGM